MDFDSMPNQPTSQIINYQTEDGQTCHKVWFEDETNVYFQSLSGKHNEKINS